MLSLTGKSALITGGGSGIGKAIATLFANQGAIVHIIELTEAAANAAASEIRQEGGIAHAYACDISNQLQVAQVFRSVKELDILVNNAGIAHIGNADNTEEADFVRVFNVNVKGTYNCIHAAIPLLKARAGGVILNMASVAATVGLADRFAYSMSKGAVFAMTLSVAKDYLAYNIRCNSLSPARIHTPFVDGYLAKSYPGQEQEMFERLSKTQPIGRMGRPEEVAAFALYLCADEASFITGNDYLLDGGFIKLNS